MFSRFKLSSETEHLLKDAVDLTVKTYGEQSLSELEAEYKDVSAAEKMSTQEAVILKLREVYRLIRKEYATNSQMPS